MLKWARILIIQDELLVAWSLRDVLSLIGCEVTGIERVPAVARAAFAISARL